MCGIFGVLGSNQVDSTKFIQSLDLIAHRGPDSQKIKTWESVKFGFNRLAIQDLSERGDQPMSLRSSPLHIIFNGEIYNYKIIRSELEKIGEVFNTETDTEVILVAYKRWGLEVTIKRLEGMFAFALYDEKNNVVFLARDIFGQKPLFYSDSQNFIFSSEIKSILNFTGKRKLDLANGLNPIFLTGLSPKGRTLFEGVKQIEGGEYLTYCLKNNTFKTSQYFHIANWVNEETYHWLNKMPKKEFLHVYSEALQESLKLHVLSDAPLGSLFSAGLDSSLITAIATKYTKKHLSLFYFESESQVDDTKYALKFSQKFKSNLIVNKGNDDSYIYDLPRMIYHYETVNKEEGPVLAHLCKNARKNGFKALLTGDASDEIFGGQSFHCSFYTQSSYFNNYLANRLKKFLNRFASHSFINFCGANPVGTHYLNFPPGIGYLDSILDYSLYHGERLPEWKKCLQAYSFIKTARERDTRAYILDEIGYRLQRFMIRSDRFGMMESMEIRTPFLHPSLVKLAVNTPVRWLIHLKKPFGLVYEKKHLIRELAKKFKVPNDIIYRKKMATPYNNTNIKRLVKNWPLENLSEHLGIKTLNLTEMALNSYGIAPDRTQYSFLASEILIRLFINQESPNEVQEIIKKILEDKKN